MQKNIYKYGKIPSNPVINKTVNTVGWVFFFLVNCWLGIYANRYITCG